MSVFLSVLTPTRNYERFLPDALTSVEAQAGDDVEHVVVDGASTDGTIQLLQQWADRIRYISEPDNGQSDALNKAAAMSSGQWVGWLNADEFYLPAAFETFRAALRRDPAADVIYGDCCLVDARGQLMRLHPLQEFHPRTLRWYGPILASCAVFIRASAMPERGWDVRLRRTMDWDLYLELERRGARFVHVAAPLAAFRVHAAQVTARQEPIWAGEALGLRARHALALRPGMMRTLRALGRVDHVVHKLTAGAYQRELRVRRRLRGSDLRWFASQDARANAERLLSLGSAP